MQHCPLLFTFRERVSCNGFLADVTAHGRALAVREEDGVWMFGVNPGGMAAGGGDESEAYLEFRKEFSAILFDIADEAGSFDDFKVEVERFFNETNQPTLGEWEAAVAEVRAGRIDAEGIPKKPADSPRFVEVTERREFLARDNELEPQRALAA